MIHEAGQAVECRPSVFSSRDMICLGPTADYCWGRTSFVLLTAAIPNDSSSNLIGCDSENHMVVSSPVLSCFNIALFSITDERGKGDKHRDLILSLTRVRERQRRLTTVISVQAR